MNFSLLSFGFFSVKIYGFLLSVAFVWAAWKYYKSIQKRNFSVDFFVHHFWHWLLVGLLVGRLLTLLLDPGIVDRNGFFSLFTFWDGEVHFYGTMLGFLLMLWWDLRREKEDTNFLRWIDAGIEPLLLGILVMDWAGFLTGSVYGNETALPWGVQYETFGVNILTPVHPVTIYAFLAHLWIYRWIKSHAHAFERTPGKLSLQFAVLYFFADFLLHFFRGDETTMLFEVVRVEQLLALLLAGFFFWRTRK